MTSPTYSDQDKLACARREIAFRRRVYPEKIRTGRMTPQQATREIQIMEAIARDYEQGVGQTQLLDLAEAPQP